MAKQRTDGSRVMGIVLAAGKGTRMQSELPKVLHEVSGRAMVEHVIDRLREAGVEDIVVVVGYRAELVRERLGESVRYAVQEEQLGTGHAVASAKAELEGHLGPVVVAYGDMPLLSTDSIRRLIEALEDPGVACSLLTISLPNPPAAGRIIRDEDGEFLRIVEQQDCTEEQRRIQEINVGTYCFRGPSLLTALGKLRNSNNQAEYYLTDVPEILRADGARVVTVSAKDIMEVLGVNDKAHLRVAEGQRSIEFAEQLFDLIDVVLAEKGSVDALLELERKGLDRGNIGS